MSSLKPECSFAAVIIFCFFAQIERCFCALVVCRIYYSQFSTVWWRFATSFYRRTLAHSSSTRKFYLEPSHLLLLYYSWNLAERFVGWLIDWLIHYCSRFRTVCFMTLSATYFVSFKFSSIFFRKSLHFKHLNWCCIAIADLAAAAAACFCSLTFVWC